MILILEEEEKEEEEEKNQDDDDDDQNVVYDQNLLFYILWRAILRILKTQLALQSLATLK